MQKLALQDLPRSWPYKGILWAGDKGGSCSAATSPPWAGALCVPGEGVSEGGAGVGCLCLHRLLGLGLGSLPVPPDS